jgi:hypothetical protein
MVAYLVIQVYWTMHKSPTVDVYWDTIEETPNHSFTSIMSRNRFQEISMRFHISAPGVTDLYERVS